MPGLCGSGRRDTRQGQPRRHESPLKDYSTDALFQHLNVEVDQESQPNTGELQIADHLCLMKRNQPIDRLDLQNEASIDKNIQPVLADDDSAVCHGHLVLRIERDPSTPQLLD